MTVCGNQAMVKLTVVGSGREKNTQGGCHPSEAPGRGCSGMWSWLRGAGQLWLRALPPSCGSLELALVRVGDVLIFREKEETRVSEQTVL